MRGLSATRRAFGLALLAGLGLAGGAGAAAAQDAGAVTLYDNDFRPYAARGAADASGNVVVFGDAAFASPSLAPPSFAPPPYVPPPPGPVVAVEPTAGVLPPYQGATIEPIPPIETGAGPISLIPQAQDAAPPPAGGPEPQGQTAAGSGGRYKDGIYLVNTDYLLGYPINAGRILTSPLRFERDDWINVALVAGIAGGLLVLDEGLKDFWQGDLKGGVTEALADGFRPLGESRNILAASLGIYALAELLDTSEALDLKREKAAALLSLQSFLLTQGFITGLKYVTGRERPENTDDAFDFEGPSKADFNASFPSGHAGSAFAVASVLSEIYGPDNPWVPWVAYGAATGTALARVDDNRHWVSDVFVGGAIGLFTGQMVARLNPFLERNGMALLPFGQDGAQGVALSYKF